MVREFQDRLYGCRHIGTVLEHGNPDFVKLAESYGIEAARAENNAQAKELAQHISCSFRRAAEALEKIPQDHPDS